MDRGVFGDMNGWIRIASIVVATAVLSAGCEVGGPGGGSQFGAKTLTGGAFGAAGGGLLASALHAGPAGIAAGVLLGGLAGGAIGSALDDQDRRTAALTNQRALETSRTGQTTTWNNPDRGTSGTVTPTRTFQAASGQYCREFEQTITIGGQRQNSYGTACRQPDGSWQIVG